MLHPGVLYLGSTMEVIGSNSHVPLVEGRSSVGRLGLQVHVTAGVCDVGFLGTITLEMTVVHPLRVYAGERVAQVIWVSTKGDIRLYKGRYQGDSEPVASRMYLKEW